MSLIKYISPHGSLVPFVREYSVLQFKTHQLERYWPRYSGPEMCVLFFLEALPESLDTDKLNIGPTSPVMLKGISTRFTGNWKFQGVYTIFRIHFTPNGFYNLFKIPLKEFTNTIVDAKTVFGSKILHHKEQLCRTDSIQKMAAFTDGLLKSYNCYGGNNPAETDLFLINDVLLRCNCTVTMAQYAKLLNMGLRNFERKFAKQVGTSPKMFCRLLRFNRAIELKLRFPKKSWTEIAMDCEYYDQMHMVRDFIKFAGSSPTNLFRGVCFPTLKIKKVNRKYRTSMKIGSNSHLLN